jgi:Polysaccharide lyase
MSFLGENMTVRTRLMVLLLPSMAILSHAPLAHAADPVFHERFETACVADNADWKVSNQLRKRQPDWATRFNCAVLGPADHARQLTVEVRPGDGNDNPAASNPTERAEIEIRRPELVRFDQPIWYRFAFRIDGTWQGGANRTVIHQIKQNIAKPFDVEMESGAPCVSANPFFRIHVREFEPGQLALRADVAESLGCPSEAGRHLVCPAVPIKADRWHTVHVAMRPSTAPATGQVRVWVDGVTCGAYRGRFGYPTYGVQRDGKPFIDTPPRFGIYRDALDVTQRISFGGIAFWTQQPVDDPVWRGVGLLALD